MDNRYSYKVYRYCNGKKWLDKKESGLYKSLSGCRKSLFYSTFLLPTDLSWTTTVSQKWQARAEKLKKQEQEFHKAKIKELEKYNVYAWPYENPLTKEVRVMWFIDKDGARIFDEELQAYVEEYGRYLEGIYEIVDWEKIYELDLAARRRGDGKNYLTAHQIPKGLEWMTQANGHIETAYWYATKTGLLDLALIAGLSYAASKSQITRSTSANIANVMDERAETSKKASGVEKVPKRPSWRQAEIDAELDYKGYDSQKSFLNGEEVPYGTRGSSRPELYNQGHSIEVKNYNIQTNSGQNNLINNVSKQIKERLNNLPTGTNQTIIIDVRGQNVTNDILKNIRSKIIEKSGVNVEIIFKR